MSKQNINKQNINDQKINEQEKSNSKKDKLSMSMTNRFLEKENLLKQFDKKTVTIQESVEKTFEYAIKGSGTPTVIFINGAGGPIEGWMKLWPLIDQSISVFAYNRLGIDKSSAPQVPQNGIQMVADLRALLKMIGLEPPYILVGHSLGGFVAHIFAATYPQEVTGVIFLESSTIEDVAMYPQKIKGDPMSEVNCVGETVSQIRALKRFPSIPVAVIAGFHPLSRMLMPKGKILKRFEHQKKLLELSVQSSLIVATKSGHFPQMNEPRLIAETIYTMAGR